MAILAPIALSTAQAIDTIVVFNEVHYHPADGSATPEFIEIYNQCAVDVDLSGWRISGGIDFDFPSGTVVDGDGYLVVAADPSALEAQAGISGVLGPFTGMLDNGGETLRLRNNNDRVMDELEYDDRRPWPVGADGSGASLSKIEPLTRSDLPEHWTHSLEVGGSPGTQNFGPASANPGGNVALGKTVIDGSSAYNNRPFDQVNGAGQDFRAQNVTDGSTGDVFGANYWLGTNSIPNQYFTLDLGQVYDIDEIRLRNTHNTQYNDRGTLGFRLFASSSIDGSNQLVAPQQILSGTLARVDGQDPIAAEIFTSASGLTETNARYLKFEVLSAVNNNAGLNEIEVYTADPVGPPPAEPEDLPLWINEVAGTADASFWVELYNSGDDPLDLEGFVLAFEDAGEFTFPAGASIAAGDHLLIDSATLSLPQAPADGENLYLYQPAKVSLLDAVRIDDLAIGRVPDGLEVFTIGLPGDQTPDGSNTVTVPDSVVINEIMYHHRPQYASPGDPPTVTNLAALGWNDGWRFNQAGDDLGTGWANSVHPVGGNWDSGDGPFGYETSTDRPPEPIVTPLTNPALNSPRVITFYFETEFDVAAGDLPNITALKFSHEIDDGAIWYLNGQEIQRYQMPAGVVTAATLAQNTVATDADAIRFFEVEPTYLVEGNNRLSVEVHQSSVGSSDVVMGLKLDLELTTPGANPPTAYAENDEEWIELFNRSGAPVQLDGWELDGGVRYTFPTGTQIPTGGYLVVARDLAAFQAKFPGVAAVGGFSGSLSNRGERLLLHDTFNNPVDELAYFDDKPWPSAADGGGSSLELRHPEIDNSLAASWAASDNAGTSSWQTYEYTITAQDQLSWNSPPQNGFHELRLGLLEGGEVLIDDVSVVEDPGGANIELIADGDFNNTSGWRLLGTHQESYVFNDGTGNALRIVASDRFNYLNNLIESNLTSGGSLRPVQNGTDYRIRFRARWLSGSPQFRFELYYNKLAQLVILDQPPSHGTPGAQNSTYSAALGPDIAGLTHSPAVPSSGEAITVSARAADPDGVGSMTLKYSINGGTFQSTAMVDAGSGLFEGTIPGQANDALVHFYLEARDASPGANLSYAPPLGPDSRALIRVATPNSGGLKQSIRINMLAAEVSAMHVEADILDNHRRGCTLITDEGVIAYDAGIRLRGSMFSRRNRTSTGLNLKFPSDRRYRGLHSTVTVRTGNRREILVKHIINAAGGMHDNYNDIVQLNGYATGPNGRARMEMARFGTAYLDGLPGGDGTDGTVFKMEGIRVFQATQGGTPDGQKLPFPIGWVSSFDLADQGDDQETYRHNIRINTGLARDHYDDVIEMCQLFSLSGQALEDAAPAVVNVDMWCRQFATLSLCGIGDTYTQGNPHNLNFYSRPDGLVEPMPWDWDFTFNRATNAPLWGNKNLSKLFARPVYTRLFHGHLYDIINTTYNAGYLTDWFNHLGACSGENYSGNISYVTNRANHVLSQLPAQIPFTITSNGGADFSVDASRVTLTGDGWINVREVFVNGAPDPIPVTWTDADSWQVEVPIAPGPNALTISAVDHQGALAGSDTITVTNTGTVQPASASNIAVSEIHYHPPGDVAEEYLELQNIHPSASVDLSGAIFVEGIDFEFPAGTTLAPGAHLLLVQDLATFNARYGAGLPVAGVFENDSRLANGGERIRLEAPGGIEIRDFSYGDDHPWPESPDGDGPSLVLVAPETDPDHSVATNWRPSTAAGGNPGASDATTFPGGDLVDYALAGGSSSVAVDGGGRLVFSYPRQLAADDIIYSHEISTDLINWQAAGALLEFVSLNDLGDGIATVSHRAVATVGGTPRWFVRLRLSERP